MIWCWFETDQCHIDQATLNLHIITTKLIGMTMMNILVFHQEEHELHLFGARLFGYLTSTLPAGLFFTLGSSSLRNSPMSYVEDWEVCDAA